MITRKLLLLIFILNSLVAPNALAETYTPPSLRRFAENYGRKVGHSTRDSETFKKASTDKQRSYSESEIVGHTGQALILIMILSGVELLKKELALSDAGQKPLTREELLDKSGKIADHILNDGHIWVSLLSAGALGKTAEKPLAIINSLIDNETSKPILRDLLKNGIGTFVTFVGWEMGSQLFTEATEMIDNDQDYERATRLLPVLLNSLYHGLEPQNTTAQNDWRILQLVAGNMVKILVKDDELRNLWLYNTWRTRIATGEFVTLVSSMTISSVIGTSLFPGAGTLGGMMFGVVGGVISIYVPEEKKDSITEVIQNFRSRFWLVGDDRGPLFNHKKSVLNLLMNCVPQQIDCPPLLQFNFKNTSVENMGSILFEKIFRYESRLQTLIGMRSLAQKNGQLEAQKTYELKINDIQEQYKSALGSLKSLYGSELQETISLYNDFKLKPLMTNENIARYPQLGQFRDYGMKLVRIDAFISEFVSAGLSSMGKGDPDYMKSLYRFYFYGYSEKALMSVLGE